MTSFYAAVERMRPDPSVQSSIVLAETLKAWARTDGSVPAAAGIACSVLSAILAFSEGRHRGQRAADARETR